MLVRRYQGKNEEEALAKAKAELGPEAIILHIKQLSKNGSFDLKGAAKVEVIVALDHDLNEFTQHKELPTMPTLPTLSTNHQSPITNHQNSPLAPAERFKAYAISSGLRQKTAEERTYSNIKEISEPRAESQEGKPSGRQFEVERNEPTTPLPPFSPLIKGVRGLSPLIKGVRGLSKGDEGVGERSEQSEVDKSLGPAAQELYQHLLSHEVQGEIAQRLSLSIQELLGGDSSLSLREALNVCIEELIRTSGGLNISQKPSVVAFIGPTGVGKTTTIAKLAAHYHLRENQRISLITADTYRIAAIEQLKTYATYIGIPLEVALTPQEMHQLVRKHKNCDLILIDTPGRSQKDSFRIQELKMILSAASPQEVHLLLNVTTQHRVLRDVVRGFKVFSPNRLLFTKLDESACFGHILNLSVALGEPVSYLTTGQEVPDDIQLATIERITEYLLREGDVL